MLPVSPHLASADRTPQSARTRSAASFPVEPPARTPLGVRPMLKAGDEIVCVANYNHVPLRNLLPPDLNPQVEHVMQIHVGQKRRYHCSLRRTHLRLRPFAFFRYARFQPFLDQPQHSVVSHSMFEELYHPLVIDVVEAHHHTLPTSSSFQIESQSFVHIMRLKGSH